MSSLRPLARLAPRRTLLLPRTYATQRPALPKPTPQATQASEDHSADAEAAAMNGNYPDPSATSALPLKRQFRDPYADW